MADADVRLRRNYLTQDMIRRILRDYFGYEVNFVMNVTDIEDKVCPLVLPFPV
jgi:cysteinyl-tRNA synthetase